MKKRIVLLLAAVCLFAVFAVWRQGGRAPQPPELSGANADARVSEVPPAGMAPVQPVAEMPPVNVFDQFGRWADEYARAGATGRAALMEVGVDLAKERRAEMLRLIQTDPQRALREAVPYAVRKQLPPEILRELETPVTASGELTTTFRCDPEHKHAGPHLPPERRFRTADALYTAYVYDWREQLVARVNPVLHGVALDDEHGSHLAVLADAARALDPAEAADLLAAGTAERAATCHIGGEPLAPGEALLLDLGAGTYQTVCSAHHSTVNEALRFGLIQSISDLRAAQDLFATYTGPEWDQLRQLPQFQLPIQYFGDAANSPSLPPSPPVSGSIRLGQRRLLLIPAKYNDEAAPVATVAAAENSGRIIGDRFDAFSYGFEQMNTTVTPPVTLPHRIQYYDEALAGAVVGDAIAEALRLGYVSGNYDHVYVIISSFPSAKFGGISSGLVFGAGAGTLVHEIGHNTGLGHANFFDNTRPTNPQQPNPALPFDTASQVGRPDINGPFENSLSSPVGGGNGSILEYGDRWDTMGGGGSDFGAPMKIGLGWLPRQAWREVTSNSETHRVFAFDQGSLSPGRTYALQVQRREAPSGANSGLYTLSHRRAITDNPWLQQGLLLQHGGSTSLLLDTTPGTPDERDDSAIVLGRTFTDPEAQLHITPVDRGGTGADAWLDVVVNRGDFPGNVRPQITTLTSSPLTADSSQVINVPVGTTLTFTVAATDADGDRLSYHYEFSDGTFIGAQPIVTRTFNAAGHVVVRCEVSDLKGGVDSTHLVVRVGTPATRNIRGRVVDNNGFGVANVRVHNGISPVTAAGYRYGISDARGYYTIPNLAPGNYEVSGFRYRYRTVPLTYNFGTVTVAAVGDTTDIDLLATPLPRVNVEVLSPAQESGAAGVFRVTRTGPTNAALLVSAFASSPDGALFATSLGTNTVVTIPAGATFADVTVTPQQNTAGDGGRTVELTLALADRYTNVVSVLTNSMLVLRTNVLDLPGWERGTRLTDGATVWVQVEPNYVLGGELGGGSGQTGRATARMPVVDDDVAGRPAVSVARANLGVVEGSRNATGFVLTRAGAPLGTNLTVTFTLGGTATNGVDYLPIGSQLSANSYQLTFAAGEALAYVPVVPLNNAFVDGSRTVLATVTATPTNGYTVSGGAASVTIVDDDRPVVAVYSGDPNAGRAGNNGQFTLVRNGDLTEALEVKYLLTGTAIPGLDYAALSGTAVIAAGARSVNVTVVPTPVPSSPGPKTVTLLVSDAATYNLLGEGRASVRIAGQVPTVNVTATTQAAEGGGAGAFTVTRSGSTAASLTVFYAVGGTANENTDYAGIGTQVVIPAGSASAVIAINPANDNFREYTAAGQNNDRLNEHEYVELALLDADDYEVGGNREARVTITDDDGADFPMVGFLLSASTVREDAGTVRIPLRIAGNPTNRPALPIRINWSITGGTAVLGTNYSGATSGQFQFISNMVDTMGFYDRTFQNQSLNIPLLNDTNITGDRTIVIALDYFTGFLTNGFQTNTILITNMGVVTTNFVVVPLLGVYPTNAVLGDYRVHTVTLQDVSMASVSVASATALGFENGVQPAAVRITRTGSTAQPLAVNLFVDGTAVPGADYVPLPAQVTIPAGTNSVLVPVVPIDDVVEEEAETVRVTLLPAPGLRVTGTPTAVLIVSDDSPIQFTSVDFAALENSGAAAVTVIRTGGTNDFATVDYVFSDLTATNGVDYLGTNGSLNFQPGDRVKTILVPLVDDTVGEGDETLRVTLVNPLGGAPLGGQQTTLLVIRDDDVTLDFAAPAFPAYEHTTNAVLVVERRGLSNGTVSVVLNTADGSATDGVDYQGLTNVLLTFLPGETSKTVLVPLINDTQLEADESVLLTLSNPQGAGAVLGANSSNAVITIREDDARVDFTLSESSIPEYGGFAPVQVRRIGGAAHRLTVGFRAISGTASNGLDFAQVPATVVFEGDRLVTLTDGSGQVAFVPGETDRTIFVPVLDDVIGEGHETFQLILSNLVAGPAGLPVGTVGLGGQTNTTVTILDDELPGSVDFAYAPVLSSSFNAGGPTTTVQGTVRNAINGQGLPGVTVNIGGVATISGVGGAFTLPGIPVGVVQVDATLTGFTPFSSSFTLLNQPVNTINFTMSPGITSASTVRLVLTWGQNPADLDSYLQTPPIFGQSYLINFFNRGNLLAPPFALLDVDDVDGFGPETITITNAFSGTYNYYINRFSGLGTIAGSGAKVEVYTDAGLVQTVLAPNTGTGDFWHVLQLDGDTRAVTVVNQIQNSAPGIVSNLPPAISQQPASQSVPLGGTAVFTVLAGGSPPLAYQWRFNGNPVTSETNSTLVVTNVGLANAGSYTVQITNAFGSVVSSNAVLSTASLSQPCGSGIGGGFVFALAVDPVDNKAVVGGSFTTVNGVLLNRIARLTPQGLVDGSFNPGTGANSNVFAVVVQGDGRVLLGGEFTSVAGAGRVRVARLLNNGALDAGFDVGLGANGPVRVLAVQADGKVLVGGEFTSFAGQANQAYLARLNVDGTWDSNFVASVNGPVHAIAVSREPGAGSGGPERIYIGGCFTSAGGLPRTRIAALGTNGAGLASFNPSAGTEGVVRAIGLQSDGRVVIGGAFTNYNFASVGFVARLLPNGQRDVSFAVGTGADGPVNAIAISPAPGSTLPALGSEKIYVAGAFRSFNGVARAGYMRLLASGEPDGMFATGTGANGPVYAAVAQPNSALVIGGDFTSCNGIPRTGLARIHGDESSNLSVIDLSSSSYSVVENAGPAVVTLLRSGNTNNAVTIQLTSANGTAVAPGDYTSVNSNVVFAAGQTVRTVNIPIVNNLTAQGDRTVLLSLSGATPTKQIGVNSNAVLTIIDDEQSVRFSAAGYSVEEGSNAVVTVLRQGVATGTVSVTLASADGSAQNGADYTGLTNVLMFGPGVAQLSVPVATFADGLAESPESVLLTLSGASGALLAAPSNVVLTISDFLFVPGTIDTNFNPGTGANNFVRSVAFQSDGKLVAGGAFTQMNGTNRNYLARLHGNGALDLGFNTGTGPDAAVSSVAVETDGRVYLGGSFSNVNGARYNRVVSLVTNGSVAPGFSSPFTLDAALNALALRGDGRVLLGGFFSQPTIGVTRLEASGVVDYAFAPAPGLNGPVHAVAAAGAGGAYVGGGFTSIGGVALARLARLDAGGAVDVGFVPAEITGGVVYALAVQADGKVLVGGSFTAVGGTNRNGVARLNTDGTLDGTFDPGLGANATVFALAVQANGKIVAGGAFTSFAGQPAGRYARLLTDGTRDAGFDSSIGANGVVYSVAAGRSRIALGGAFTTVNGLPRGGVALLRADPPSPRFTEGTVVPPVFAGELETEPGVTYVIEASADLLNWTPISTNTAPDVVLPVSDPDAGLFPERFYRARVLEQ